MKKKIITTLHNQLKFLFKIKSMEKIQNIPINRLRESSKQKTKSIKGETDAR